MRARVASCRLVSMRAVRAPRRARQISAVAPTTPGARGMTSTAAEAWVVGEQRCAIEVDEVVEMESVHSFEMGRSQISRCLAGLRVPICVAGRIEGAVRNAFPQPRHAQ